MSKARRMAILRIDCELWRELCGQHANTHEIVKVLSLPNNCKVIAHSYDAYFECSQVAFKLESPDFIETMSGERLPMVSAIYDKDGKFARWEGAAVMQHRDGSITPNELRAMRGLAQYTTKEAGEWYPGKQYECVGGQLSDSGSAATEGQYKSWLGYDGTAATADTPEPKKCNCPIQDIVTRGCICGGA